MRCNPAVNGCHRHRHDVNVLVALPDGGHAMHRQVTDACLLALAVRNNGRLATFDLRMSRDMVIGAKPSHLPLIV